MSKYVLGIYWNDIPTGKANAVSYIKLTKMWGMNERQVRKVLHELSCYDNGDDFILIRSAKGAGFYKTDNIDEIRAFKQECLNKGRSTFAPIKKINKVLASNDTQYSFENNLRVVRETKGLKQKEVCKAMKKFDSAFDTSLLSKMENSVCLPTYWQLHNLAEIYGVQPFELINDSFI